MTRPARDNQAYTNQAGQDNQAAINAARNYNTAEANLASRDNQAAFNRALEHDAEAKNLAEQGNLDAAFKVAAANLDARTRESIARMDVQSREAIASATRKHERLLQTNMAAKELMAQHSENLLNLQLNVQDADVRQSLYRTNIRNLQDSLDTLEGISTTAPENLTGLDLGRYFTRNPGSNEQVQ